MAGGDDSAAVLRQWNVVIPGSRRGLSHETEATLSLLDMGLIITAKSQTRQISFEDLIGIRVYERAATGRRASACIAEIHSLPVVKRRHRKNYRKYIVDRIMFTDKQTFQLNKRHAEEWKVEAMKQCQRAVRSTFCHSDEANLDGAASDRPLRKRKLLVFINPASGPGKSEKLFQNKVQPLFDIADIELDIIVTERAGHAKSLVKSYDLSQIDGIVVSSGDGLTFEVLNGLMNRDDKETAIKIPLGHIPTGSGNALCASLLYQYEEDMSLASAALQIIRGGVEAVDLATVHTVSNETLYMLLLAQWGMLADIDIESERFRRLGGKTRDILGAIKCIAQGRTYRGRLHYLPVSALEEEQESAVGSQAEAQQQKQQEGHENSTVSKEDSSTSPTTEVSQLSNMTVVPSLLPRTPVDPLPATWKSVEGVFLSVTVLMAPVMGDGFVGHPNVTLGSGEFTILYFHDNLSKAEMLSMLKDGDTGNWINHPKIHIVKAKAYRIEPISPPGLMTLDGEVIEYGASQAQIHQHVARVFSRKQIVKN